MFFFAIEAFGTNAQPASSGCSTQRVWDYPNKQFATQKWHSPAVPPDFFSTDATALKMVAILFDNGLITADTYHQVISRYST